MQVKKSSWINDSVSWVKESITNAYEATSSAINWLFNKEETSQNVVGFYDEMLGRLNKVDVKKLQDLCKEFKIKWNAKGDTHKCMQNIASLLNNACDIENSYANNSCANNLVEHIE